MPANMMKEPMGSRPKVTGRSRATVKAGPIPGRMPTMVPKVTPTSAHSKSCQVRAMANPSTSSDSASKSRASQPNQHRPQDAGGQAQAQPLGEGPVDDEGQDKPDDHVPPVPAAAEGPGHAGEQDGGRDDEARPLQQENLRQQRGHGDGHRPPIGQRRG